MVTFISFILVLAGSANWLLIGLMQYDFVAGIFGTQSSLLSRIVYIAVGFAAIWLLVMSFVQKGKIKINDNGFKRLNKALPAPDHVDYTNQTRRSESRQKDTRVKQQHSHNGNNNSQNQQSGNSQHNQPDNRNYNFSNNNQQSNNFQTQHPRQTPPFQNFNPQPSNIEAAHEFNQTNSQNTTNPFD